MSAPKYTYAVEVEHWDGWLAIVSGERRDFALGYFLCLRQRPSPRLAARLIRSDGSVLDASDHEHRAHIGMVAGFPTPEQYEAAAEEAMATAAALRKRLAGGAAEVRAKLERRANTPEPPPTVGARSAKTQARGPARSPERYEGELQALVDYWTDVAKLPPDEARRHSVQYLAQRRASEELDHVASTTRGHGAL